MKDKILEFMAEKAYKPLTRDELIAEFSLNSQQVKAFRRLLSEMEARGDVIRTRRDRYGVPRRMNLAVGRLQGNAKGFAFLIPDDEGQEDIFIAPADTNGAMHNDRVIVRILGKSKGATKAEGEIIRILQRHNTTIVGTFEQGKRHSFVAPDDSRLNWDILVSKEDYSGAVDNEKVVVEITSWPQGRKNPEGRIIQRLGLKGAPGTDILSIIYQHGLPLEFPKAALAEAAASPEYLRPQDMEGRQDFRSLDIVTIDGGEARDLDDAISIAKTENGYRLGVHIADVSHYVRPGSALDKEAEHRGTSAYLVDRVIPMLPEKLSNGICSLNPNQDRLTVSLMMEIDGSGIVTDYKLSKGIICTRARLTYEEVDSILRGDRLAKKKYSQLVPQLLLMAELTELLGHRRTQRGAIDFDFPETEVKLDAQGKPVAIVPRPRTIADRIIEEFMLVANETVARHFASPGRPFVYRIHEKPASEKIIELNDFLHNLGYRIKGNPENIHPKALQQMLQKAKTERYYRLISTVTLRSLRQARYSEQNAGHFGLASEYYTHFTAPIRRYPDLLVHRFISYWLGEPAPGAWKAQLRDLKELAAHCSRRERGAEDADRESVELKKVEYMEAHLGETFSGIISGVTSFGLFVELENSVEGLVHVSNMHDDYYRYNEKLYSLVGERTKRRYRLADPVTVKLVKVNKEARTLDLHLVKE